VVKVRNIIPPRIEPIKAILKAAPPFLLSHPPAAEKAGILSIFIITYYDSINL
jgi:hypothetical protein